MQAHVIALAEHQQVLWAIVQAIAVPMVDPLAMEQWASKHLRSDQAMLELVAASDADLPVAEGRDGDAALPVTGAGASRAVGAWARTEARSATVDLSLPPLERLTARLTGEWNERTANALHRGQWYHFDAEATP